MRRTSFDRVECPIARATEQLGDGWTLLIVRHALMGVRCFADFERLLDIPPSTLIRRLDVLCEHGILVRERYQSSPPRDEYLLTEKGREVLPIILSLAKWGARWLCPRGAPIEAVDAITGIPIDACLIDAVTGQPVAPGKVALAAGPSASRAIRDALTPPLALGSMPSARATVARPAARRARRA